ncbi:MAG TPA: hypothetical protein VFN10_15855 [Thermoanaerobaculia bacterium]|nr:hypothetical protein [Thermoanaerobaculia bacterium]
MIDVTSSPLNSNVASVAVAKNVRLPRREWIRRLGGGLRKEELRRAIADIPVEYAPLFPPQRIGLGEYTLVTISEQG